MLRRNARAGNRGLSGQSAGRQPGVSLGNVKNHAALIEFGATGAEALNRKRAPWIDEHS
jgi:hypothetical protein